MAPKTAIKPPAGLSRQSAALWRSVLKDWAIEDSATLKILEVGLRALDRAERCRATIDNDGETIDDRFGQIKTHPLLAAERDARAQFLAALRQLHLDLSAD